MEYDCTMKKYLDVWHSNNPDCLRYCPYYGLLDEEKRIFLCKNCRYVPEYFRGGGRFDGANSKRV